MPWRPTDQNPGERPPRPADAMAAVPETLNQLFRMASLAEGRRSVLLRRGKPGWRPLSDERLARRVSWLAQYLREVFGIRLGDRVAIASGLRQEWLLADLAIMTLGAVSVAIEPDLPGAILQRALHDTRPRLLFASGPVLRKLRVVYGHVAPQVPVIAFDGRGDWDAPVALTAALDAGSVLDTPARSRALRQAAWDVDPDTAACCHYVGYLRGHVECVELSHAEAMVRVAGDRPRHSDTAGERVYVTGPTVTLRTRLALYAAIGDGHSSLVLGTPGLELEEIRALRPEKLVASPGLLEQALGRVRRVWWPQAGKLGAWAGDTLRRVVIGRARAERRGLRAALGGRVRWIAPTEILEPEVTARLSAIAVIGPLVPHHAGDSAPTGRHET